jgi:leucyl aminopeptidase
MFKIVSRKVSLANLNTGLLVLTVSKEDLATRRKTKKGGRRVSSVEFKDLLDDFGPNLLKSLKTQEFKGEMGQEALYVLPTSAKVPAVLLLGWSPKKGAANEAQNIAYRHLGSKIAAHCAKLKVAKAALSVQNLDVRSEEDMTALIEGLDLTIYDFDRYKSSKAAKSQLKELTMLSARGPAQALLRRAKVLCESVRLARDLVNTPALDCTPAIMLRRCRAVARASGLSIKVYDRKRLQQMKAGALLAVASGSDNPPYLVRLTYRPKKKNPKVLSLVGKGITFDSGGLSIKPSSAMDTMKMDMAGAAAVLAVMQGVAALKPNWEIRGYMPLAENMINGHAIRPGDIVKAMNGKSIEILNTDAEGRLILADALCLADKEKADCIIDLATLTGACVVALGTDIAAMFSDDDKLCDQVQAGSIKAGEKLWRMPLEKKYKELLKSPIADLKNIGSRWGGSITAALFLEEFVKDTPWMHIDIAGPAWSDKAEGHIKKGGTGFPVRTLLNMIEAL